MQRSTIETRIIGFLRDEACLKDEQIRAEAPLFSSGLLSSLEFIDLVSFMEREFGIAVAAEDADFDHLDTLERIVAFVASRS